MLAQATLICAEDPQRLRRLLAAFGIRAPEVWSVHDHNESATAPRVAERLESGAVVALVSDAGTPAVSDPGYRVVQAAVKANQPVRAVPGASAVLAAIASSGLPPEPFAFLGFAPKTATKRVTWLQARLRDDVTNVLYAPARDLNALLAAIAEASPHAAVAIGRELTKRHESWYRGHASQIVVPEDELRGEAVVLVRPPPQTEADQSARAWATDVAALVDRGLSRRDAVIAVAVLRGAPKRDVQRAYLDYAEAAT